MILKDFKKILDKKQLNQFFILTLGSVIVSSVDALGVLSILPFVTLLANPALIAENYYLNQLHLYLEEPSEQDFMIFVGVATLCIIVLGIFLKTFVTYFQIRFVQIAEFELSKKLLDQYLSRPYEWFLSKNTADLEKQIFSESSHFVGNALLPLIQIVSNSMSICSIFLVLLIIHPLMTLISLVVVGGLYSGLFLLLKDYLGDSGRERLRENGKRFRAVSEALGGVKQVKFLRLERFFLDSFSGPAKRYAVVQSNAILLGAMPKFLFELIAFGGIILVCLIFLTSGTEFATVVPIIATAAFAGYRLMPSIQQVYTYSSALRFGKASIERLAEELGNHVSAPPPERDNIKLGDGDFFAFFENVSYRYPGTRKTCLTDINLTILENSKIGIVGFTGSGKTTLVDLLCGLLKPSDGKLNYSKSLNDKNRGLSVGYVTQDVFLSDQTIKENIAFGVKAEEIDFESVLEAAKRAQLHEFISTDLDNGYEELVGERGTRLSGGQRQRLGIARALYHKPNVLVMDEATSALDNITEQRVLNAINDIDYSLTTIIISHNVVGLKHCDQLILLDNGKIVSTGSYEHLFASNKMFRSLVK